MTSHSGAPFSFPPIHESVSLRATPVPSRLVQLQQQIDVECNYLSYVHKVLSMQPWPTLGRLHQIHPINSFRMVITASLSGIRYPIALHTQFDSAQTLARRGSDCFDECLQALKQLRGLPPHSAAHRRLLQVARQASAQAYQHVEALSLHITQLLDEASSAVVAHSDEATLDDAPNATAPHRQARVIYLSDYQQHHPSLSKKEL